MQKLRKNSEWGHCSEFFGIFIFSLYLKLFLTFHTYIIIQFFYVLSTEWEAFQLKAIREKNCFYLWALLTFYNHIGEKFWEVTYYFKSSPSFGKFTRFVWFCILIVVFPFIFRLMKKLEHSWKALVYDGVSDCCFLLNYISSDFSETLSVFGKMHHWPVKKEQKSL